jgi:hypothetical protein
MAEQYKKKKKKRTPSRVRWWWGGIIRKTIGESIEGTQVRKRITIFVVVYLVGSCFISLFFFFSPPFLDLILISKRRRG